MRLFFQAIHIVIVPRDVARAAGFKDEEIEKMDLANTSDEEFQNLVRKRLLGMMQNNGSKQRVITLNGVETFILQGWEFVAALPDDRAIIKTPF